jgi:hypothetical protein
VLGGVERKNTRLEQAPLHREFRYRRPQQVPPRWGRFFDIRLWPFKVLVEGDHAIAAVRLPLAMVLTAVAVAIVGVAVSGQHSLLRLKRQ